MTAVELYRPRPEELAFKRELLADPETMAYNLPWGGTIDFGPDRWADWYRRWVEEPQGKRYYRYLWAPEEQAFVGEIAYHLEEETGRLMADVIVHARYRGKGYGSRGLELLCQAAAAAGWTEIYDSIGRGNPAVELFRRQGFVEIVREGDVVWVKKELSAP